MSEWVCIKDRLPQKYQWVICYGKNKNIFMGHITKNNKWSDGEFDVFTVTHWMPLPEPPKEDYNE